MSAKRSVAAVVLLTCALSLTGCKSGTTHKAASGAKHAAHSVKKLQSERATSDSTSMSSPISGTSGAPSAVTLWSSAQSKLRSDHTLQVQFSGSNDITGQGQGDQQFATTIEGETSGASTHLTTTVSSSNMTIEIIRVGGQSYLKGNKAYWQSAASNNPKITSAKIDQNADHWVSIPESVASKFTPNSLPPLLSGLTNADSTGAGAITSSTPVSAATFHGQQAWKVDETSTQSLYISKTTNDLIGLTKSGDTSNSGNINEYQFLNPGKDFNIQAPANPIPYAQATS